MSETPKPQHPISHVEVGLPGAEWVDEVYLDGEPQPHALAAPETGGWVVRYELDPDGNVKQNAWGTCGNRDVAEKVEGEVRITLRDKPSPEEPQP
jgi:hypothetical protein